MLPEQKPAVLLSKLPLTGLEADDVGELERVGCKQELADAAHLPSKAKPALWLAKHLVLYAVVMWNPEHADSMLVCMRW